MTRLVRWCGRGAIALVALGTIGCAAAGRDWTDDIVWSPDGARAAVLTDGLHLMDRDGTLSPVLATDVYRVAWLNDSQRLLLARSRRVSTFGAVEKAVRPERARMLAATAEHLWQHIQSPDWPENIDDSPDILSENIEGLTLYLREHHEQRVRASFTTVWPILRDATAELHRIEVARVEDGCLTTFATVSEDLQPIKSIRPGPGDRFAAFATKAEDFLADSAVRLFVVPIDGSAPPALVARGSGESFDWRPDGRSLVFFDARVERDLELGTLGCIANRRVVDGRGRIAIDPGRSCVVDVIFEARDRIRSLRDGRILFDGFEHHLPRRTSALYMTLDGDSPRTWLDPPRHHQLFVFDPASPATPPLPLIADAPLADDAIGWFDVSPDGMQVVYTTGRGRARLVSIAEDRSQSLPLGLEREDSYTVGELPRIIWSGADAFTYARTTDGLRQYILRQGASETVLNRSWPK